MTQYKNVSIAVTFRTRKRFDVLFQKLLDEYSEKGWTLHSFHFDFGSICAIVFEREID